MAVDAPRGLSLRMDHGTQYLSDHFQNQLKYWGISPSFAFIEQPQTNGVAERFIRTPQRAGHLWSGVPESSGGEAGGQALCGHLQPRVAGGEKRLQKPLASQGPVARPSLTRSSGLIKTCVQETGCGTILVSPFNIEVASIGNLIPNNKLSTRRKYLFSYLQKY